MPTGNAAALFTAKAPYRFAQLPFERKQTAVRHGAEQDGLRILLAGDVHSGLAAYGRPCGQDGIQSPAALSVVGKGQGGFRPDSLTDGAFQLGE